MLHTYSADYKLILMGDATMSPYEIAHSGGSVEHWNEESGETWMRRLVRTYPNVVWFNPMPQDRWRYFPTIGTISEIVDGRMYPLTVEGLDDAMHSLSR